MYSSFRFFCICLLLAFSAPMSNSHAVDIDVHPRLRAVYNELVDDGIYSKDELSSILEGANFKQNVLDAMMSPAEYKLTWGKYRKIFIKEDRIEQGVDFWLQYADSLARAEQRYGVPASMIVSIIGVESKFGKYKGKHKVLDSLVTLIAGYERRSKFFASELIEFLTLCKENQLDPDAILGSYAGAMGYPQFISSSYRNFAVDFNGDGVIDLINQQEDAIGSIANYFLENGWRKGEPVSSVSYDTLPSRVVELSSRKRKVQHSAVYLRGLGAPITNSVGDQEMLGVLTLNVNEIAPMSMSKETYLVRAGDTACQIAERHNVSCKALFKLNKLNQQGRIYRGQKLRLPKNISGNSVKQASQGQSVTWQRRDDAAEIPHYFFTHHNFYVITRYNQSVLYAMAVYDLSTAIADAYMRRLSKPQ